MLLVLFLGLFSCCHQKETLPVESVEVTTLINLDSLSPKINIHVGNMSRNFFSIDSHENFYFLDIGNHRILKFDNKGQFIDQIGSIGQEKKDLFSPLAFCTEEDSIYVLNNAGRELKVFSLSGDFISSFLVENAWQSEALCVYGDHIFITVKYKDKTAFNENKLISIFNFEGDEIINIGKIIKCESYIGYREFNSAYINVIENRIFGAFRNRPIIFGYDIDGKQLFLKDLRNFNLPEIQRKMEQEKALGLDTPNTKRSGYSLKFMTFCTGFGVGQDMNLYYAINNSDLTKHDMAKCYILHFNEKGTLIEKIIPKKEGEILRVRGIFIKNENIRYGIGLKSKNAFLFKF